MSVEFDDTPIGVGAAARCLGMSGPTFLKLRAAGKGPEPTIINDREKFRPSRLRKYLDTRTGAKSDD